MKYERLLNPGKHKSSAFILGPRMTGKTFLLRELSAARYYDLLDPQVELAFRHHPETFGQEVLALPDGVTVIVDEVQKLPVLLDYVQMGIDRKRIRFFLSGSSARKLKRGMANLLGGRALDFKLHPLTHIEIGDSFDIDAALSYGTLPNIYNLAAAGELEEVRLLLKSYYTTYIKEEIQSEALLRNLAGFQRFLSIAATADGRTVAYANIAKDSSVPESTVKDHFSILEDTLIGRFVWPWDSSERKKARPKFYLFDCGITRMLLNRLVDPPTGQELGLLFESWFVNEAHRLKDYYFKDDTLSFWRERDHEIDMLVHNRDDFRLAIEIKSGELFEKSLVSLRAFRKKYPHVPTAVASLSATSPRRLEDGILILPWKEALRLYLDVSR